MAPATARHRCFSRLLLIAVIGWIVWASPWLVVSASAQGDVLYGTLLLATNAEHPRQPPEELQSQAENLKAVFGYNEFRLLGQKRKSVPNGTEDWLVSSRRFFLRVNTKNPVPGGYALELKLLQETRVLVEAQVTLSRSQPLYIRGPFVGQGQLVIVLMVL